MAEASVPEHAKHVHHEPATDVESVQITHDPATDECTRQAQHIPTDQPDPIFAPESKPPVELKSPAPDVKPEPTGAGTIGSAQAVDPKDYVTHDDADNVGHRKATEPYDPKAKKDGGVK